MNTSSTVVTVTSNRHGGSTPACIPKASATRKSIAKNFELGQPAARGKRNPISLHSVDDELFALVWSWIAETLVAETSLKRSSKESISELISQFNDCPLCEKAHRIMLIAAHQAEVDGDLQAIKAIKCPVRRTRQWYKAAYHKKPCEMDGSSSECILEDKIRTQALEYADYILTLWQPKSSKLPSLHSMSSVVTTNDGDPFGDLSEQTKVEIALLVLLFNYLNRVVNALLGEQVSSAFFRVPRSAAAAIECRASLMAVMSRMMAKGMVPKFHKTHAPGEISAGLFGSCNKSSNSSCDDATEECTSSRDSGSEPEESPVQEPSTKSSSSSSSPCLSLPNHLQRADVAGEHAALALKRITTWVEQFEQDALEKGLVSESLLRALDANDNEPSPDLRAHRLVHWVTVTMRKHLQKSCQSEEDVTLATLFLLVGYTPKSVYHSFHWNKLVEAKGEDTAKRLVIWWSLRWTLARAKGLE